MPASPPPEPPNELLTQLEAEWQKTQTVAPDRDRSLDPVLDEALLAVCARVGIPRAQALRYIEEARRTLEARQADGG